MGSQVATRYPPISSHLCERSAYLLDQSQKSPRNHIAAQQSSAHTQSTCPSPTSEAIPFSRPIADGRSHVRRQIPLALTLDHSNDSHESTHMLRRKTTRGTLEEAYDGTDGGKAAGPPPAKRLALAPPTVPSLSPTSMWSAPNFAQWQPGLSRYSRQTADYSTLSSNSAVPTARTWYHASPSSHTTTLEGFAINGQPIASGLCNAYLTPAQYAFQPPSFPIAVPASPYRNGPFGPYWPDGRFVPYRPATQQSQQYDLNHGQEWSDGFIANQGSHPRTQEVANLQHENSRNAYQPIDMRLPCQAGAPVMERRSPNGGIAMQIPFSQLHGNIVLTGIERPIDPYYPPPHSPSSTYSSCDQALPYSNRCADTSLGRSPNSQQKYSDKVGQAHFRDRALHRSHRVYVDLLAKIQSTKRAQPAQQGSYVSDAVQVSSAASIYPKPPYHSLFLNALQDHNSDARVSRSPSSDIAFTQSTYPQVDELVSNQGLVAEQRLPTTRFDRRARYQRAEIGYGPPDTALLWTSPSGMLLPTGDALPIAIEAQSALETLETLCLHNPAPWFEGLLLAGCLAYGLGNFPKAAALFQTILRHNPDHVEAISNLAASLLSLGRRQEAEQQWLRAVRFRPSYFEAIEHLIGLFCHENRSRAAINLINFIDQSLRLPSGLSYISTGQQREGIASSSTDSKTEPLLDRAHSSSTTDTVDDVFEDHHHQQGSPQRSRYSIPKSIQAGGVRYAIPPSDNGRIIALVHARGNLLYASGDQVEAARSFELAVLIACGQQFNSIKSVLCRILEVYAQHFGLPSGSLTQWPPVPLLLPPERAIETARLLFPHDGTLPGLSRVPSGLPLRAAVSIVSNSLLSLAKIYQDGICTASRPVEDAGSAVPLREILLLYYLSLSLQPSPSTANNVGILLAGVQQSLPAEIVKRIGGCSAPPPVSAVQPGSGIALALAFYQYGLTLDQKHAHLYTNFGSLLKDIGHLSAAIKMYEMAVQCDGNFDIALANLANAVKDQGRVAEAIQYYRRAVVVNPNFAEAVCGLANALNSVCSWDGRGGETRLNWPYDQWHVGPKGELEHVSNVSSSTPRGWMKQVVDVVTQQLHEGLSWGQGVLFGMELQELLLSIRLSDGSFRDSRSESRLIGKLKSWKGKDWEGSRVTRLIQRLTKRITWRWYQDRYVHAIRAERSTYPRPSFPSSLSVPAAPTVLPFHTFTCPLGARSIRMISQRNALRLACTTLKLPWLSDSVFPPPSPPKPALRVGYVSSDFNNHPLAHLMQSVFGMHDQSQVVAYCYATSASDGSIHRQQIERESPHFQDVSSLSSEMIVKQIVKDQIHILINLNGYTRGARNEVFAARAAPVQMAFMGFAGSLGAEWCDYLLADTTAVPPSTLRPYRRNVNAEDILRDNTEDENDDKWMYSENIIFCKNSFFCCDHKQSAPDATTPALSWEDAQTRNWAARKALFPTLPDNMILLANFNQLYKFDPTTYRTWLRILERLPNAVLWLLRFPELGERHLRNTARLWAGNSVAERIVFTDVSDKSKHLERCGIADLVLDTGECNAHTTAADVLWSGTPMITRMRYEFKMCSRMGGSIVKGALPSMPEGRAAEADLIVDSEDAYEEKVVQLASGLRRAEDGSGRATGRLVDLKKILWTNRWTSSLFDTRQWVRELERAYWIAWNRWVAGEGGDIWL